MTIKVCGMRDADNIQAVEQLGIDWMGMIFWPKSSRFVADVPSYLPKQVRLVGVFVDAPLAEINAKAEAFGLTHIQLHGHESPQLCQALKGSGFKLIKAFSIAEPCDLNATEAYDGICDYFLFDTKTPAYGGSGKAFDWDILSHYHGSTPFLLSGGIGPESIEALQSFSHPALAGYDLNSRFEVTPGVKEVDKVMRFKLNF